jgi:hypothetical protein
MNIEILNAKVDKVISSIENAQSNFTETINIINEDLIDLKKRVESLEKNNVSEEEGFTNLVNTNNLPTFVIALLITLLVYVLNQPLVSNKLNFIPNKYLRANNLKLIIVLIVSFILIKYN